MKKTSSEFIYIFQRFLRISTLFTAPEKPNGIISTSRRDNSDTEDVIVNSLSLDFDQVQEGVFNINIWVKNLHIENADGTFDDSQQDIARCAQLERLFVDSIMNFDYYMPATTDYSATLQQIVTLEADKWHYLNCRIEVTAVTP